MSEPAFLVLTILGTAFVTCLIILVGSVVATLREVRSTARTLRSAVDRLAPTAEETLENLRQVSDAAARGSAALVRLGESLPQLRSSGGSRPLWIAALTGLFGLFAAVRRRRAARESARYRTRRTA